MPAPGTPPTTEPLRSLLAALPVRWPEVEQRLARELRNVGAPLYSSVDVRRSAWKAAAVDCNAFPAGFNNLDQDARGNAARLLRQRLAGLVPASGHVALVAEGHTRNPWYYANLAALRSVIEGAGWTVTPVTLNPDLFPRATMPAGRGLAVRVHGALRRDGLLVDATTGTPFDAAILNHDLSLGVPDALKGLEQPVLPALEAGWHVRRKSRHLTFVDEAARLAAHAMGLPAWAFTAHWARVRGVDFHDRVGMGDVAEAVDAVVARTQASYDEWSVTARPRVFVKAEQGTFGMGIATAASGAEFLAHLNSRRRAHLDRVQHRIKVRDVIVQEAVPTALHDGGHPAEPVVYSVGGTVAGAFLRRHPQRSEHDNLNQPGMTFRPLPWTEEGTASGDDAAAAAPRGAHAAHRSMGLRSMGLRSGPAQPAAPAEPAAPAAPAAPAEPLLLRLLAGVSDLALAWELARPAHPDDAAWRS